MSTKTVTVVGVGALGSHVVQFLRGEAVTLKVIDFDRVERKNTLSQFHGMKTIGKSKVQSLQQTMQFLFARKIEGIPHRLREENLDALLKGSDLVLDCLDNHEARSLVCNYVREGRGLSCLHGALAADGQFGRVIWDEYFVPDDSGPAGIATCEDGGQLPFIGMVATHLAYATQIFLREGKKIGFSVSPAGVTMV